MVSTDGAVAVCARIQSQRPYGSAGWIHQLTEPMAPRATSIAARFDDTPRAVPGILDATYQGLLSILGLSESHREHLRLRKLFNGEIEYLGYKTLPEHGRHDAAARLEHAGFPLPGVPGFYRKDGVWNLAGAPGILIPVRALSEEIQGLQIRSDQPGQARYRWLSSRGMPGGSSPGVPVHVAGRRRKWKDLWVTEGPIKADIASIRMGCCVLAVAGVGNWAGVPAIARALQPRRVIVAFDSDKLINPAVQSHGQALMAALAGVGIRTYEASWASEFKGIDDLLVGS